jgi:DNA helicase-2/ATP-dependent DNA helicase PcrA
MQSKEKTIALFDSEPRLSEGNLQIIACAGSGKTDFVSSRIAYLIYKKIAKPENIIAFTFTEKAADELKFRIRKKIRQIIGSQPDVGDMYVGTIHSFCFELLKEYIPRYRGFDVLDEGKRYSFILSISKDLNLSALTEWLVNTKKRLPWWCSKFIWTIDAFIKNVDMIREELTAPEKISVCDDFTKAFHVYENKLEEKRFLDFSGMMAKTLKYLEEDPKLLSQIRKRYAFITVDEYQDINPIQEKIIKILTVGNNNLCVVGDDDQSIYQWRGSTVDNILTFEQRYPKVYAHHLFTNYRSTDTLISLSSSFISQNTKRLQKIMKSTEKKGESGDIYRIQFYEQKEEIQFIITKINNLIGVEWHENDGNFRGLSYSDIAMFFRSVKNQAKPYLDALDNAQIPYIVSGVCGLMDTPEILTVFFILSYLGDFEPYVNSKKLNNENLLQNIFINLQESSFLIKYSLQELFDRLEEYKSRLKEIRRISLQSIYSHLLMMLGVDREEFHQGKNEVDLYNLGHLSQIITDYEISRSYFTYRDLQGLCYFIQNFAQRSYDAGPGEDLILGINAVRVMTLHATKGLGFPVVFMPSCIEKYDFENDPGFLDPSRFDFSRYEGTDEDERRLFYVGMTRSKKFLFLSAYQKPLKKRGKIKKPSQFFTEVNHQFCLNQAIPDTTPRQKVLPEIKLDEYRFPTSYSELSDYFRCEYDYKMRYVYGFNPGIVDALGYGKQMHAILNYLHLKAQEANSIPDFKEAGQYLIDHFYLRYASDTLKKRLLKSALRSLQKYLDLWKEDFTLSVKSERPFEFETGQALISGSIDLIKREPIDEEILEIIDFKTGNARRMDEELHLQVQVYTIAAQEALNLNVQKAYVHHLDDLHQNRVEILVTPKQLELAHKMIDDSITGILQRRFNRNPRQEQICEKCDWKYLCPKNN